MIPLKPINHMWDVILTCSLGDKLLLLRVLQGLTLQEQVEAILENRGRLFATTAKGKLKTQVANCNLENKSINDTLTAELERYKEQVKVLKEGQNVDLRSKKAQQSKPKLCVGDIIVQTNHIVIPDLEETLALAEESRSKMLLKHKDNMMLEKKKQVDTTPIDYAALNQLYKDFPTRFVPQTELSADEAIVSEFGEFFRNTQLSIRPTNVEVPKKLPKVSMVNTILKKLKHHLANFDVVVKERTTPTAIAKGS
ncbi:hypothetical protein Tco_1234670 [Tanacetum coccineum]